MEAKNLKNLTEQISNVIEDLKKNSYVDAIYLFGSHATGNAMPFSDIDLCVIASYDIPRAEKEDILSNSSRKIDISLFYDLPLNIRFRVIKDGKLLYQRDELLTHRTKVKTVDEYLDFKHIIDRHTKNLYINAKTNKNLQN
ncbi:MAG: nucleotidyltransferase domain-containing protein [Candidatus Altiarchaeales archaeon HGW-Altiarchaeales-2]|nr:MAG: nucleotidyltransferase domain-containing protein [Candidatus Altiarchaeales archaeon HGW-Altiarchaeales-2]